MPRNFFISSRVTSKILSHIFFVALLACTLLLQGNLSNLTQNDPYPYFSTRWPYSFLTKYQKLNLMHFEYSYPVYKFRISVSPFRQSATFARDHDRNIINLGDLQGRWNILALFYDPPTRVKLMNALCLKPSCENVVRIVDDIMEETIITCSTAACGLPNNPCLQDTQPCNASCFGCGTSDDNSTCTMPQQGTDAKCAPPDCVCWLNIIDPRKLDFRKEFGFFTVPMLYRKYGVRVEQEMLLYDCCWYAIGFKAQVGIVDIRQTVLAFQDLSCQALGIACPAQSLTDDSSTGTCPMPDPQKSLPPPSEPQAQTA